MGQVLAQFGRADTGESREFLGAYRDDAVVGEGGQRAQVSRESGDRGVGNTPPGCRLAAHAGPLVTPRIARTPGCAGRPADPARLRICERMHKVMLTPERHLTGRVVHARRHTRPVLSEWAGRGLRAVAPP
jgi:hypothetical protein